jgi:hypothetical protein
VVVKRRKRPPGVQIYHYQYGSRDLRILIGRLPFYNKGRCTGS